MKVDQNLIVKRQKDGRKYVVGRVESTGGSVYKQSETHASLEAEHHEAGANLNSNYHPFKHFAQLISDTCAYLQYKHEVDNKVKRLIKSHPNILYLFFNA